MESTTAPLARTAPTDGLADLVERPGPFATIVLETEAAIDNAAHLSAARWRGQRDEALANGVPEAALGQVDDLVADAHRHGRALFVVTDGESGEPLLVEHLAAVPDTGTGVRWGPLPGLVPLLADRQARLPHVVVRCDREGADVLAVDADLRTEATKVADDGRPYRHARSVGWQELRGWHRAQRHLAGTAEAIATAAAEAANGIGANLAVVTGDDRTVAEVVDRLSTKALDARVAEGGRGGDGSEAAVDDAVDTLVRTVAAEHTVAALQRFREAMGTGLAVDGDHDTREALAAGRVDVLVVHNEGDDRSLVDEAVRAALGTSAAVVVVPGHAGPRDGIGGLLRWR